MATKKAKVGEVHSVGKTPGYVRLPGGEVATAVGDYPFVVPGEHVFVVTDDHGKTTETKVDVTERS